MSVSTTTNATIDRVLAEMPHAVFEKDTDMSRSRHGRNRRLNPRPHRRGQEPVIDMGNPTQMVGLTGFVRLAGGGFCSECEQVFATLLENGLCAGCSGDQENLEIRPLQPLDRMPPR